MIKTCKRTKKFLGCLVISLCCLLSGGISPEVMIFFVSSSANTNASTKSILIPPYSLVFSAFPGATISQILCRGTRSKISFLIIQPIAIDMVNLLAITNLESHEITMHPDQPDAIFHQGTFIRIISISSCIPISMMKKSEPLVLVEPLKVLVVNKGEFPLGQRNGLHFASILPQGDYT